MNYKIYNRAIQEYINEIRNLNIISDIKVFYDQSLFIIYLMDSSLDKRIENIELNLRKKYRNAFNKNIYVEEFYSFYGNKNEADDEIKNCVITDITSNFSNVNIQKMKMGKKLIKQNNMNVYNPPMKNNIAYHISFYSGTLPSKKYLSA
ncbi:hypothetical protein R4J03_02130 [Brachyspira intermedia]|uniref:hypothetical protein n=1 Tax=Brachyspira intermedia TaxID=84377 RepID=UPI00262E5854|nr:hypothetical protein [uncultured Brachyspira sp.]